LDIVELEAGFEISLFFVSFGKRSNNVSLDANFKANRPNVLRCPTEETLFGLLHYFFSLVL
jgi:hypothetical protein